MNNIQLSNSLWALSQLGCRLPAPDLDAYWAACLDAAELFHPRDIATLLAAAAALRAAPPQRLLDVMGFRARVRAGWEEGARWKQLTDSLNMSVCVCPSRLRGN